MARLFSSNDAIKATEAANNLIRRLYESLSWENTPRENVIAAKNTIATKKILGLLKDISVDELSNEKNGLKIKPIHDAGFHTYADLHQASLKDLSDIQGISLYGAENIKGILSNFISNATKKVRVRLSYDDQNPQSNALVQALSIYIKSKYHIDTCRELHPRTVEIQNLVHDIKPGLSTLKWFFTGREKKSKAEASYSSLQGILTGDYAKQVENACSALDLIKKTTVDQAWNEFLAKPIDFYNALEKICPGSTEDVDGIYGLTSVLAKAIEGVTTNLEGFKSTLRRYQEWGVKYILHQQKVLLGDEMGLGKTIQAIAAMVSLRNSGATHFLVICPASVITNWCREIELHSDIVPIKVHGPTKAAEIERWKKEGGIAITTFETTGFILDCLKAEDPVEEFKYDMLIVDEAHYIKNPRAKRSCNVRVISDKADRILFMTGTALENHVNEMLELMDLLNPDVTAEAKKVAAMSMAPDFMGVIAPVYYRRKREDVLAELPELIESPEWCEQCDEEVDAYEKAVMSRNYAALRRVSFNIDDMENSAKMQRLLEIVEDAKAENRKVIAFSFFLDTIEKIRCALGPNCIGPISGSVTPKQRQELVDQFNAAPAGTVLVSQILAGGVGLNIQAASVVILCEPQFKPSLENQAISRAYRMGQGRSVLVYRLLAQGAIDEYMMALLQHKQNIFDAFADKSLAASATESIDATISSGSVIESPEINEVSFKKLVEEEIQRIKAKTLSKLDALGHKGSDKIRVTDTFLERTFNLFNKLYFEEALSKVSLKIMPKGNCLGLFNPDDMSISIAEGEWKYQTYRNAMVHEMCHMFVHMTAGPSSAGAGDGHGKDWLEKANQLNADFPELNISLYADEHPD